MNKIIATLALLLCFAQNSQAQGITYRINLNDPASINKNVKVLAETETKFWVQTLSLNKEVAAKLSSNNYAMYNQYVQAMKYMNYNMENVLLVEQKNFKAQRDRFMKMFLTEKQYKSFLEVVVNTGKQKLKKYKDEVSIELRRMRTNAAGWNVMHHRIQFSS